MGEWRVQVSVRVSQATRTELEKFAAAEKRTLANFGAVFLEWGFEQWRVVSSTERLIKYKIPPRVRGVSREGTLVRRDELLPVDEYDLRIALGDGTRFDRGAIPLTINSYEGMNLPLAKYPSASKYRMWRPAHRGTLPNYLGPGAKPYR